MTGLTQPMQRDWRRHGFLPSTGGKHAKFDIWDVAMVLALRAFSEFGLGPSAGVHAARAFSPSIVHFALSNPRSWDVRGTLEEADIFREYFSSDAGVKLVEAISKAPNVTLARLGVIAATDQFFAANNFDDLIERRSPGGLFLDIEVLAAKMVRSAPRGLVTVTFNSEERRDGEAWVIHLGGPDA